MSLMSAALLLAMRYLLSPFTRSRYQLDLITAFAAGSILATLVYLIRELDLSKRFRDGSDAEQFSYHALKKLKRFGFLPPINGIDFDNFDVDHVLIGPSGAWAFETKWTSFEWKVKGGKLLGPLKDPIAQAKVSAKKIDLFLNVSKRLDVPINTGLIIWGPGTPRLDAGYAKVNGILVLAGADRKKWAQRFASDTIIPSEKVAEAYQALADFADKRIQFERRQLGRTWRYYVRVIALAFLGVIVLVALLSALSIARILLSQ